MLSEIEFRVLTFLKKNEVVYSQRYLAGELQVSLGKINKILNELFDKKLVRLNEDTYQITNDGYQALEPYKVKNAVIMAAGMSSRFAPLSYERPKGLLKVKGEILIEREIQQLQEAGISDIIVVVGYMKEKFFYLEEKYGVKIVVNNDYYKYNNTSTLMKVLDQLSNTYICSSDNYFVNNVFEQYVYRAYYSAVYATGKTDEYCLQCAPNGKIKKVTIGGEDSWYMLGHVYFDKEFSSKLKVILEKEYSNIETRTHLWENLYMRYISELDLYIRKYDAEEVLEFDSLEDLRTFDSHYINNADSSILENICHILHCEMKDIVGIQAIKAGLTNTSFHFTVADSSYVYRHPGKGTEKYINRKSEAFSMEKARLLGVDDTFIYMDEKEGWKLSKYIEDVREMDYHNISEVKNAIVIMRKLHDAKIVSDYDFGIWNKTNEFIELLREIGKTDFEGFDKLLLLMPKVYQIVSSDSWSTKCLCHNDCYSPNFILDRDNKMYLIDWEYSGNDDPASDLGTFICCSDYSEQEAIEIIKMYLNNEQPEKTLLAHFVGYVSLAAYYWFVWALYQESRGNLVGEWLYVWYKNSKKYAKMALEMYAI